jgi:penicillin-binding protein 1A
LGYTYGPFPKPWVKITKEYDCPSPQIDTDSLTNDSLTIPIDTNKIKADTAGGG